MSSVLVCHHTITNQSEPGARLSLTGFRCSDENGVFQDWEAVEFSASPLPSLSVEEAAEIGGAMLLVWAIAWGIRRLVQLLGVLN